MAASSVSRCSRGARGNRARASLWVLSSLRAACHRNCEGCTSQRARSTAGVPAGAHLGQLWPLSHGQLMLCNRCDGPASSCRHMGSEREPSVSLQGLHTRAGQAAHMATQRLTTRTSEYSDSSSVCHVRARAPIGGAAHTQQRTPRDAYLLERGLSSLAHPGPELVDAPPQQNGSQLPHLHFDTSQSMPGRQTGRSQQDAPPHAASASGGAPAAPPQLGACFAPE